MDSFRFPFHDVFNEFVKVKVHECNEVGRALLRKVLKPHTPLIPRIDEPFNPMLMTSNYPSVSGCRHGKAQ